MSRPTSRPRVVGGTALDVRGRQHAAAAEDPGLLEAEVENSSQPLAKASSEASALRQLRELRSADRLLDPSGASRGWRSPPLGDLDSPARMLADFHVRWERTDNLAEVARRELLP